MTGVRRAGPDGRWDGHVLLVHGTETERLDGVAAWVRRGLDRGEMIFYGTATVDPDQSLSVPLGARGVDAVAAVRDGRLRVVPLEEYYAPDGQQALADGALAEGFPAVRMSAEAQALLPGLPRDVLRKIEARNDALIRSRPVSALCQYPQPAAAGTALDEAVAMHPAGVRQAGFAVSRDGDDLVLQGEVDPTTTDLLVSAVTAAVADSTSPVLCLDLAGLGYIDGGSCWRLDDATRRFRAAGGQVLLVAPQPAVARTMWLLELDLLPGVQMVEGEE